MLKVYLTDLAAYNKGFLYGEWITLPMDDQELSDAVDKVLKGGEAICAIEYGYEKHEEYFIADFEWEEYKFFDIDEYSNIAELNDMVQILDGTSSDKFKAIMFLTGTGIADTIKEALPKVICQPYIILRILKV